MNGTQLRALLTPLAHDYGNSYYESNYVHENVHPISALIFKEIYQNFHPDSWRQIENNSHYYNRTLKQHSHFKGVLPVIYEMQSSNSSDALAMNIFCFPDFENWKGVLKLLKIQTMDSVDFGSKAKVNKEKSGKVVLDETEVDILINAEIVCECKLTENGFTSKKKDIVRSYTMFNKIFHVEKLPQSETTYSTYQLIRNILAAEQHNRRFILICDKRRPDLATSFYQTVNCIKDDYFELRTKCEIVYWQDLAHVVGKSLKNFLNQKYGIK